MSVDASDSLILASPLRSDPPTIDSGLEEEPPRLPGGCPKPAPPAPEEAAAPAAETPPTVSTPELPPDSTTSDSPCELAMPASEEAAGSPPADKAGPATTPPGVSCPEELPSSTAIDLSAVQAARADIPPSVIPIQAAKDKSPARVPPRRKNSPGNLDLIVRKLTSSADPARLNGHEPQKTENDCQKPSDVIGTPPNGTQTSASGTQTPANGTYPSARIALDLSTKGRDDSDDGRSVKSVKWGIMKMGPSRKKPTAAPGPSQVAAMLPPLPPPPQNFPPPPSKLLRIPQYVPQSVPQPPQLQTEVKARSEIRLGGMAAGATVVTHSAQSQTVNVPMDLNIFDKRFDPRPLTSSRASQALKGTQIDLDAAAASLAALNGNPFVVADADKRRMAGGKMTPSGGRLKNQPTQTSTVSLSAFPPAIAVPNAFPPSMPAPRPSAALPSEDVRGAAKRKRALRNSLVQTVHITSAEVKKPTEEPRSQVWVPPKVSSVGQQTTPIVRQLMLPIGSSDQPTMSSLGQQTNVPPVPIVSVSQHTPPGGQRMMSIGQQTNPVLPGQRVHPLLNQKTADSFSLTSIRNGSGCAVAVATSLDVPKSSPVTDPAVIDRLKRLGTVIEVEDDVLKGSALTTKATSTLTLKSVSNSATKSTLVGPEKNVPILATQPSALKMLETMTIDPPQSPVVSALDDRPLFLGKDISVFAKKKTSSFQQAFSKTPLSIIPVGGPQSPDVSCLPKTLDTPAKIQNNSSLVPAPLTISKALPIKLPSESLKNLVPIVTMTPRMVPVAPSVERTEKIIAEPDAVCFPVAENSNSVMEPPLPFLEPVVVLDEEESLLVDGKFMFKHNSSSTDVFSCDICSAAFHQLPMLRKHYYRLHVARQFISEKDLETYHIDLEEKGNESNFIYRCHTCRQCLPTKDELKSHLTDHPPVADLNKPIKSLQVFRCNKCSAHFKWRKALSKHKKSCKVAIFPKPPQILTKAPQVLEKDPVSVKAQVSEKTQVLVETPQVSTPPQLFEPPQSIKTPVEVPSDKVDERINSVTELALRQVIDTRATKPAASVPQIQHKSVRKTRQSVAMAVHSPPHIPQSEEPFLNRTPKMSNSETQTYPSVQQIRSVVEQSVTSVASPTASEEGNGPSCGAQESPATLEKFAVSEKTAALKEPVTLEEPAALEDPVALEKPDTSKATQAVDELLSISAQVEETLASLIGDRKSDKKESHKEILNNPTTERLKIPACSAPVESVEVPVEGLICDSPKSPENDVPAVQTNEKEQKVPDNRENSEMNLIGTAVDTKVSESLQAEVVENIGVPQALGLSKANIVPAVPEPMDIPAASPADDVPENPSNDPAREAETPVDPPTVTAAVPTAAQDIADPKKLHHCLYCNETFSNGNRKRNHTLSTHPFLRKNHRCVFCFDSLKETYQNLSALFLHLLSSHHTIYFGCQSCKERYHSLDELKEHLQKRHHPDDAELKEIKSRTNEINEEQPTFTCSACTRIFLFKKCFTKHKCDPEKEKERENARVPKLRKAKVVDRPDRMDKPVRVDPEQMFFSQVAINVRDNLLNFLDGKLPTDDDSDDVQEEDPKIPERNTLNFSDGFPPSSYQLIPEPEPYSRVKAQWEKYNFPKNYDGRCGLTSYIKDMSYLDLSTQLIMRRNLQRLQGTEVPSPTTSNDVPSVLELERLATRRAESFGINPGLDSDGMTLGELSGEWVRDRLYVCSVCFWKTSCFWTMEDHKYEAHPQVHCPQYDLVSDQQALSDIIFKRIVPANTDPDTPERPQLRAASITRVACTKCSRDGFTSRAELHVHVLDCAGEPIPRWTPSPRKKRWSKKQRRQRRGLKRNIPSTPHRPVKVRTKPGDTDTIQKMIANLPAKRSTRRVIEADLKTRSQSSPQNGPLLLPNNRLVLPPSSMHASKYVKNTPKGGSPKAKDMILAPPSVPKPTDHIDTSAERGDLLSSLHMMPVSTPVEELLKPKQIFDKVIVQKVFGRQIEELGHSCKGCGQSADSRNALRKHRKVCAYYRECGPHAEHQCKTCRRHYDSLVALIEHNCDEISKLEVDDDASLDGSGQIPTLSQEARKLVVRTHSNASISLDTSEDVTNLQRERSHSLGDIPKQFRTGQRRSARLHNSISGSIEMVNLDQENAEVKPDITFNQQHASASGGSKEMLTMQTEDLLDVKKVDAPTSETSEIKIEQNELPEPTVSAAEESGEKSEGVPKPKKRVRRRARLTLKKRKVKIGPPFKAASSSSKPQPMATSEEKETIHKQEALNESSASNGDAEWETVKVVESAENKPASKESQSEKEAISAQAKQKGKSAAKSKNISENVKLVKKARIQGGTLNELMADTVSYINEVIDVDMSVYDAYLEWTPEIKEDDHQDEIVSENDTKPSIDLLDMTIDAVARGEAGIWEPEEEILNPVIIKTEEDVVEAKDIDAIEDAEAKEDVGAEEHIIESNEAIVASPLEKKPVSKKTKGKKKNVKTKGAKAIETSPLPKNKKTSPKTADSESADSRSEVKSGTSNSPKDISESEDGQPDVKIEAPEDQDDFYNSQRRSKKSTMTNELRQLFELQNKSAELLRSLSDIGSQSETDSEINEKRRRNTRSSLKTTESPKASVNVIDKETSSKVTERTLEKKEDSKEGTSIVKDAGDLPPAINKHQESKKNQLKIDESRRPSAGEEIDPGTFYVKKVDVPNDMKNEQEPEVSAKQETLKKKKPAGKKKGKGGKGSKKETSEENPPSVEPVLPAELPEEDPSTPVGGKSDETPSTNKEDSIKPVDPKPKNRPYGNKLLSGRLPSASKYAALLQRKPALESTIPEDEATRKRKWIKETPAKMLPGARRKTRSNSSGKPETSADGLSDPYDYNDEDEIVPFQEPRYKPYSPPKQPTIPALPAKRRIRRKEDSPDTTTIVVRAEVHPEPAPKKRTMPLDVNPPSSANELKRKSPPVDISLPDAKKTKIAFDSIDTVDDESSPPSLVSEVPSDDSKAEEEPKLALLATSKTVIPTKCYTRLPKPPSPLSEPPKLVDESKVHIDSDDADLTTRSADPAEPFDSEPPALEPTGDLDFISKNTSGEDTTGTTTPADTETDTDSLKSVKAGQRKKLIDLKLKKKKQLLRMKALRNKKKKELKKSLVTAGKEVVKMSGSSWEVSELSTDVKPVQSSTPACSPAPAADYPAPELWELPLAPSLPTPSVPLQPLPLHQHSAETPLAQPHGAPLVPPPQSSGSAPAERSERSVSSESTAPNANIGSILDTVNKLLGDSESNFSHLPADYSLADLQKAMGASDAEMAVLQQLGEASTCLQEFDDRSSASQSYYGDTDEWSPMIMDLDNQPAQQPVVSSSVVEPPARPVQPSTPTGQSSTSSLPSETSSGSSLGSTAAKPSLRDDIFGLVKFQNCKSLRDRPKYSSTSLLDAHQNKEVVCPTCSTYFMGFPALQVHVNKVHGNSQHDPTQVTGLQQNRRAVLESGTSSSRLVCFECQQILPSHLMYKHLEADHDLDPSQITKCSTVTGEQHAGPVGGERLKSKMSSALGDLLDKAVTNLLTSKTKPEPSPSGLSTTAMELLGRLVAARRRDNPRVNLKDLSFNKLKLDLKDDTWLRPQVARPYLCTICGQRFSLASSRNKHEALAHRSYIQQGQVPIREEYFNDEDWRDAPSPTDSTIDDDGGSALKPTCSDCGLSFGNVSELMKHRVDDHTPLRRLSTTSEAANSSAAVTSSTANKNADVPKKIAQSKRSHSLDNRNSISIGDLEDSNSNASTDGSTTTSSSGKRVKSSRGGKNSSQTVKSKAQMALRQLKNDTAR